MVNLIPVSHHYWRLQSHAARNSISDEVISRLTCTLELGLDGMIRKIQPALASTLCRKAPHSSLGRLDKLPMELLFLTFNYLDFRSLSRVLRLSWKGKAVVEALPVYRQVMEHCPTLLTALGQTRLLSFHSGPSILQTLRSDQCASCSYFGGFIFLPTCERICFECLRENVAFWIITPALAK